MSLLNRNMNTRPMSLLNNYPNFYTPGLLNAAPPSASLVPWVRDPLGLGHDGTAPGDTGSGIGTPDPVGLMSQAELDNAIAQMKSMETLSLLAPTIFALPMKFALNTHGKALEHEDKMRNDIKYAIANTSLEQMVDPSNPEGVAGQGGTGSGTGAGVGHGGIASPTGSDMDGA